MPDIDLAAIAARVLELDEQATPGPWKYIAIGPCCAVNEEHYDLFRGPGNIGANVACATASTKDIELIATYRTAAPILARAYLDAHSAGYRAGCEAAAKEAESLAERLEDNARTCPTARGGIFACRTLLAALRTLDAGEQKTVEP